MGHRLDNSGMQCSMCFSKIKTKRLNNDCTDEADCEHFRAAESNVPAADPLPGDYIQADPSPIVTLTVHRELLAPGGGGGGVG